MFKQFAQKSGCRIHSSSDCNPTLKYAAFACSIAVISWVTSLYSLRPVSMCISGLYSRSWNGLENLFLNLDPLNVAKQTRWKDYLNETVWVDLREIDKRVLKRSKTNCQNICLISKFIPKTTKKPENHIKTKHISLTCMTHVWTHDMLTYIAGFRPQHWHTNYLHYEVTTAAYP